MRLHEFEKDAAIELRKQHGEVVEALPAIAGLARGVGMAARKAGQVAGQAAKTATSAVKRAAGTAAVTAAGPNAKVGTQGTTGTQGTQGVMQKAGGAIAQTAADKASKQVSNKLLRRGGQVPLPNQDNQVQQYKVDNVQGDEVTLVDPKARRKPGQPDKVIVKKQDIEPIIKGMMNDDVMIVNKKSVPLLESKLNELFEGIGDVLYHYTDSYRLNQILERDAFRLTSDMGTDAERNVGKKDKPYYLSTARSRLGDYHTPVSSYATGSVLLVLDGTQIKRDGYTGAPVDYWNMDRSKPREYWKDEMEDRIFSDEPWLENASKYIQEVHMYMPETEKPEKRATLVRKAMTKAKQMGIPAYLYDDPKAFNLLNKKKATMRAKDLNIEKDKLPLPGSADYEPGKYRGLGPSKNYFAMWTELLLKPKTGTFTGRARDYKNSLSMGADMYMKEAARTLSADIHNARKDPRQYKNFDKFMATVKKLGLKSVNEIIQYISDKFARAEVKESANTDRLYDETK